MREGDITLQESLSAGEGRMGEIPVHAVRTLSEKSKDLVTVAYDEKYNTPVSIQYVKDMSHKKSRDTTMELVPV